MKVGPRLIWPTLYVLHVRTINVIFILRENRSLDILCAKFGMTLICLKKTTGFFSRLLAMHM